MQPTESKKVCLVQLTLVCGGALNGSVFSKKVRICGFPLPGSASSVAYVKEINYPPQQSTLENRPNCRLSRRLLTDLSYPHIDLDLAKSLEKFDYIIVNNADTAEFIYHYIKQTAIIIDVDAAAGGKTTLNTAEMSEFTPRSSRAMNHIHHV